MKWSTGQVREEPDRTVDVRENGLRGARGRPRPGYGQGVFHLFFKKLYGCGQGVFLYFQKIIMNTDKVLVEEKKASVTKVSELSKNLNRFSSLGSQ